MPGKGVRSVSWGRLKPVEQDLLESVGFPSKGDKKLLNYRTQDQFFAQVMRQFMLFCKDSGQSAQSDELQRRLAAMYKHHLDSDQPRQPPPEYTGPKVVMSRGLPMASILKNWSSTGSSSSSSSSSPAAMPAAKAAAPEPPASTPATAESSARATPPKLKSLSDILLAMRKLREALVASNRRDDFAVYVYLFTIRLSVLVKQPESYHPAILYVLRILHPVVHLEVTELQEVATYLVLDLACRRQDLAEAYNLRSQFNLDVDFRLRGILNALSHDNWIKFAFLKARVDGYKSRIMDFAEPELRRRTLTAFGRTYLTISRSYLERATGSTWEELKEKHGVGWKLDEETNLITVRTPKARPPPVADSVSI